MSSHISDLEVSNDATVPTIEAKRNLPESLRSYSNASTAPNSHQIQISMTDSATDGLDNLRRFNSEVHAELDPAPYEAHTGYSATSAPPVVRRNAAFGFVSDLQPRFTNTATCLSSITPPFAPTTANGDSSRAESGEEMAGYKSLMQSDLKILGGGLDFNASLENQAMIEEIKTAPLFSDHVRQTLTGERMRSFGSVDPVAFPQFGLLGQREPLSTAGVMHAPDQLSLEGDLVFANLNAPWSAFICGSQGYGKSHTLSCLLENSLLEDSLAGKNPTPLAGLVFHYDRFTSSSTTQVCEAAYLCTSGVPVRILVSPSNFNVMQRLYHNLPGLSASSLKPQVVPLYFRESQLTVTRMMALMAMDDSERTPLYMEVLYQVLRDMAREKRGGPGLNYVDFIARIEGQGFDSQQNAMLSLRLRLLESFLAAREQGPETAALLDTMFNSAQGTLTIVDLSCPFVNEGDACALFTICLSIFMDNRSECGRVVALDEAHKFLTQTGEAQKLTDHVVSIIRQQRHLATRVMIATQEPTLSPLLLDLCNVAIVHHFRSPAWYETLIKHVAGVRQQDERDTDLFETIVSLKIGQALVFCPSALLDVQDDAVVSMRDDFMKLKIRSRISADGGRSLLSSDKTPLPSSEIATPEALVKPYVRPVLQLSSARGRKPWAGRRVSSLEPGDISTSTSSGEGSAQNGAGHSNQLGNSGAPAPSVPAVPAQMPPSGFEPNKMPQSEKSSQPPRTSKWSMPSKSKIVDALRQTTATALSVKPPQLEYMDIRTRVAKTLGLAPAYFVTDPGKKLSREAIGLEAHKYMQLHNLVKLKGYNSHKSG